jgi:hypothetical protein
MSRLMPRWQALGLPGLLGLLLLAGSWWAQYRCLPTQLAGIEQMGSDARRLRHELQVQAAQAVAEQASGVAGKARAASDQAARLAGPEQAWAALWQGLPDEAARTALQQAVLQSAQRAGIKVTAVQYRGEWAPWVQPRRSVVVPAARGSSAPAVAAASAAASATSDAAMPQGLWRQRLTMPVEGNYPAIRIWLHSLLKQPALSLDALDIQRPEVMSDQVKGQVSVSLWWRQARRP